MNILNLVKKITLKKGLNVTKRIFGFLNYMLKVFLKKTIPLYRGEFGYEIMLQVPFAYWLHKHRLLKSTIGAKGTKELYFFSPNHIEVEATRIGLRYSGINSTPHCKKFKKIFWIMPDFKSAYKNSQFKYSKPLLIIHNKYTEEWDGPPINFLPLDTIRKICHAFSDKFQIVYIRPSKEFQSDHQEVFELGDFAMIKKEFHDVLIFQDLLAAHPTLTYNELQFQLHANCETFISVQGGNSIVASLFSGVNYVLAKRGEEIEYQEFEKFYPSFSNCRVKMYSEESALFKSLYSELLDSKVQKKAA